MGRYTRSTILLGAAGELPAGSEVPASYKDQFGDEHPVDVERLDELGALHPDGWAPGQDPVDGDDPGDGLDDLKVAELRDLADEHGIDIPSSATKADIIAELRAHDVAVEGGDDPGDA